VDAASFFSDLAFLVPPFVLETSRSILDPLVVPAIGVAVFVALAVLDRFVSSLDDFWFAFLKGGSSLVVVVVVVFLFFFVLPESALRPPPVGEAGRLLDFGVEEVPLVSPFSALLVIELEVAAAEAARRCLILVDDG